MFDDILEDNNVYIECPWCSNEVLIPEDNEARRESYICVKCGSAFMYIKCYKEMKTGRGDV